MLAFLKRLAHSLLVRAFPEKMGYVIKPVGQGYFNARSIIKKAEAQGLSVVKYLEQNNLGGVGRKRDDIISALTKTNAMDRCDAIVEIGAGTGMYLEKFVEVCRPRRYEVYEPDRGWSHYLRRSYNNLGLDLRVHKADGESLKQTGENTVELVTAHGVFVYLPIVITFHYLIEAVRVCKPGGKIVFDCFTDRIFNVDQIIHFRQANPYYDFPVVIPESLLFTFFKKFDLEVETSFDAPYHSINTSYFILKK